MARTRRALTLALIDLVLEKRYAAITIQDLLDRADIGRSTFYAHYRSKDDLLLSSFTSMLQMLDRCLDQEGASSRLAPVAELFAHVGEFRRFHDAVSRARMIDRVFQAGIETTAATIEHRLEMSGRAQRGELPAAVRARAMAGGLFALLRWWLDTGSAVTPERMDELFHAIFASG